MADLLQEMFRVADEPLKQERHERDGKGRRQIHRSDIYRPGKLQHPFKSDILLEMAGQGIQGLIDKGDIGNAAASTLFEELKIGGAEQVAAEATVEIGSLDP